MEAPLVEIVLLRLERPEFELTKIGYNESSSCGMGWDQK
jgi:hypothetical protein